MTVSEREILSTKLSAPMWRWYSNNQIFIAVSGVAQSGDDVGLVGKFFVYG